MSGRLVFRRRIAQDLLEIDATGVPDVGTEGAAYAGQLIALGGLPPYSWDVLPGSGSLPTGLSLAPDDGNGLASICHLSGTLSEPGTFACTIRVTDAAFTAATVDMVIVVAADAIALAFGPPTVSTAVQGVAYVFTFTPVGGTGTGYAFDVVAGALPDGLSLSTSGVISGTPTTLTGGTPAEFEVRLRDAALTAVTREYAMHVVDEVDDRAYFDFWAQHPNLHQGGGADVPHDALESDGVTPRTGPGWWAYWLGAPKTVAQLADVPGGWIRSVKTEPTKSTDYDYTGTTTPPAVFCQFREDAVGPAASAGLEVPCGGNDPGNRHLVFIWDETFAGDLIEASEAVPSMTAIPVVDQYKHMQLAMSPSNTGRFLENRINIAARNKPSDGTQGSPRRVCRLDLRIYDDLNARVSGPITPQYMTSANVNPTGKYGEKNPPSVPVYENLKGRHIFQILQRRPGSAFGPWSESTGHGSGGIVENQKPCAITTSGTTATVTFAGGLTWQGSTTWVAGQRVTVKGCTGATAAAFNGLRTIVSVNTVTRNAFTFTLTSDLGGASAEGAPTVGTDYDEVSWWYGTQKDGWRCIVDRIPVYHQPTGVRAWWREHDTSSAKKELAVFELTRTGTTATVTVGAAAPAAIVSMVRSSTPESGWTDPPTGQKEAWKNGLYAVLVTCAAPHSLKASPTGNRWVLLKGAPESEYTGGFNADYFKTDLGHGTHTPSQFTIYVTASSGQPSGTWFWAEQVAGFEALDSIRIVGSDYAGDYPVGSAARVNPAGSTTGGPNAGPANGRMTFTCAGTETTPSPVTGVLVRHAYLRPWKVFIGPVLLCLDSYDSPGMAAGAGVKDPVSAAAEGHPADYDTQLFVLPAAS